MRLLADVRQFPVAAGTRTSLPAVDFETSPSLTTSASSPAVAMPSPVAGTCTAQGSAGRFALVELLSSHDDGGGVVDESRGALQ